MNNNLNENIAWRFEEARAERQRMQSERFVELLPRLGEETVKELQELYSLYDENLYLWFAGLWESDIGGFYYSNSARDTEGFLPDLESTAQALQCFRFVGLLGNCGECFGAAFSPKTRESILKFVRGLQDPESGYFYHPQWGKNVSDSRRGRDLGWAMQIFNGFGDKPIYETAMNNLSTKTNPDAQPEHFRSLENYKKYLDSFDFENNSYHAGNQLAAQWRQILAAGEEYADATIKYLDDRQRSDNGLWEEQINYKSVNGLMKIMSLYTRFGKPLPNAEAALNSACFASSSSEEVTFICEYYNPWITMGQILGNILQHRDGDTSERLSAQILQKAPELIATTTNKIKLFKKDDGSFSYNKTRSAARSQGASVAVPNTNEGDINASSISSKGVLSSIAGTLGIKMIPIYCDADSRLFLELLEKTPKIKKKFKASLTV